MVRRLVLCTLLIAVVFTSTGCIGALLGCWEYKHGVFNKYTWWSGEPPVNYPPLKVVNTAVNTGDKPLVDRLIMRLGFDKADTRVQGQATGSFLLLRVMDELTGCPRYNMRVRDQTLLGLYKTEQDGYTLIPLPEMKVDGGWRCCIEKMYIIAEDTHGRQWYVMIRHLKPGMNKRTWLTASSNRYRPRPGKTILNY